MPLLVPALHPVKISDLRPTQVTVGLREVKQKRKMWRDRIEKDGPEFLGRHVIPVVLARKERLYMVDHHHLARALADEGVETVLTNPIADLRRMNKKSFWTVFDLKGWCHPYDADGDRVRFSDIPKSIDQLTDDPYRSLAGALRRAGGFAKDISNYSEFLWADFLRRHIEKEQLEHDFSEALATAVKLAKSKESDYLPGWSGVD
jgi:hypothetical protein